MKSYTLALVLPILIKHGADHYLNIIMSHLKSGDIELRFSHVKNFLISADHNIQIEHQLICRNKAYHNSAFKLQHLSVKNGRSRTTLLLNPPKYRAYD